MSKILHGNIIMGADEKIEFPHSSIYEDSTSGGIIIISGSGTSGLSGTSGSSGTSGVAGTSGSSGSSGTSGTSGYGTSGSSGTSGVAGTSGSSGSSGTSGVAGASGTSGSSGSSGTSGSFSGTLTQDLNGGSYAIIAGDHGAGTSGETVNVIYGTSGTPPTASNYPIGTLYVKYIP